jgi:uncharacterized protein YbjT (DUF2867 family)
MRVLVLGAYGLIGFELVRALRREGYAVAGLGRDAAQRNRLPPDVQWHAADMSQLVQPAQWSGILRDIDVVVNAAGALQDSTRDALQAIHHTAVVAMLQACEASGVRRVVQVSAPGATADAPTEFMRSKFRGDEALRRSPLEWVLLRPGLVLAANAYGGSALLRMAAAMPFAQIDVMPAAQIQTTHIDDVCTLACLAVSGEVASGSDIDVLEPTPHSLSAVTESIRTWMGWPVPRVRFAFPSWALCAVATCADALAYLGWRSPLRSTAIRSLQQGVVGDATLATRLLGRAPYSLRETLALIPATLQERWFARLFLLMPLMVATLSLFWIVSGVIGIVSLDAAAQTISSDVLSSSAARGLVIACSMLDIALGLAVLFRAYARRACHAMIAVALGYLIFGTLLTPALWLDPLGPLVKVFPSIMLALATSAVLEER